jgi:hypothetical protein
MYGNCRLSKIFVFVVGAAMLFTVYGAVISNDIERSKHSKTSH